MKATLTGIWHNTHNQQGVPYVGKNQKPYTRCSLKITGNQNYLSGFGDEITKTWQIGQEVEIEVSQTPDGKYWNFRLPPKNVNRQEFDELKTQVSQLRNVVGKMQDNLRAKSGHLTDQFSQQELMPDNNLPPEMGENIPF